jgi:hypothetical protein
MWRNPATYVKQALERLLQRLLVTSEWRKSKKDKVILEALRSTVQIPAFDHATGILVNYSPDHAVRFDLQGNVIEMLNRARRIGEATFTLGRRPLSRGELDVIFGVG